MAQMITPRDVAVPNVLPMSCFTNDEDFFVVYSKFSNATLESIKMAHTLRDLNIFWYITKEHRFKISL